MMSNEVAKDSQLGSLVPLKSFTSDLRVANPSSICIFIFVICGGLGFSLPWFACGWFSLSMDSILIIFVAI
jgi:hypothetical protein